MRSNGRARRGSWTAIAALWLAALVLGLTASIAEAEAPWWREEGRLKTPLPTGTSIEIDTASAVSVEAARHLAGYMRLLEYPPEASGDYEAQCASRGAAFVGVFFDLLTGQTHPVCLETGPVSEDRASALCGVIWQRRDALFAMHGVRKRERAYSVASIEGSRVVCRVGGRA